MLKVLFSFVCPPYSFMSWDLLSPTIITIKIVNLHFATFFLTTYNVVCS